MKSNQRFLVSYIFKNQPQSLEVNADAETLSPDDVRPYIEAIHSSDSSAKVSDIQVMGIHRPLRPHVHPGRYQQPQG